MKRVHIISLAVLLLGVVSSSQAHGGAALRVSCPTPVNCAVSAGRGCASCTGVMLRGLCAAACFLARKVGPYIPKGIELKKKQK